MEYNSFKKVEELPSLCSGDQSNEYQNFYNEFLNAFSEILPSLSERQKNVFILYFDHCKTQKEIGIILNITQPTVSQHLRGKKRNGRKIGGAINKIRKVIFQKSKCSNFTSLYPSLNKALKIKSRYDFSQLIETK